MEIPSLSTFIFGASAGSVATTLVSWLLGELKGSKENKRLLRKIFFERRLQVAEICLNNWQNSYDDLSKLIFGLDIIVNKQESQHDMDFWATTFKQLESTSNDLKQLKIAEAYKILAYYNLSDISSWNEEKDARFYSLLSKLSLVGTELERFREMIKAPAPGANIQIHNIVFNMGKEGVTKQREIAREIVTELRDLCIDRKKSIQSNILTVQNQIRSDIK